jgi:tRNA (guanine37-N1)-methyltransferase
MRFDILTIFPGFFAGVFDHGVVRRAQMNSLIQIQVHDLRAFAHDWHRTVDDRPFGGGEGMVLKPEPLAEALESLGVTRRTAGERPAQVASATRVVLLSAQGRPFTQAMARNFATAERIVLLCGRYEGIDERINQLYCDIELSIGDYVLSGGELAAAVVIDATMRNLPGVLGNEASREYESFGVPDAELAAAAKGAPRSQHGAGGLLDYPHYTRPAEFSGMEVPEILLSGDHSQIRRWRREQQLRKTLQNRPDLLERAILTDEDRKVLDKIQSNVE